MVGIIEFLAIIVASFDYFPKVFGWYLILVAVLVILTILDKMLLADVFETVVELVPSILSMVLEWMRISA